MEYKIKPVEINSDSYDRLSQLILHNDSGMADVLKGNNDIQEEIYGAYLNELGGLDGYWR